LSRAYSHGAIADVLAYKIRDTQLFPDLQAENKGHPNFFLIFRQLSSDFLETVTELYFKLWEEAFEMTSRRSDTVIEGESYYHCISRCVRRAYLYGQDSYSGKNYDHRKEWIRERLQFLVKVFCIEVLACALMDNHLHLLIRTLPEALRMLTNQDVARRWLTLYRPRDVTAEAISALAENDARIAVLRKRLGSVSWFMKSLNEFIARKANKEDDCKGRFWEGRFRCQRLRSEAALLGCAVYIDLNPVRAGKAETPEESRFTSAYERIELLKKGLSEEYSWLAPVQDTGKRRGFLSISLEEYLTVLDETGRIMRKDKRGAIPEKLMPILTRLGIKPEGWPRLVGELGTDFSCFIGDTHSIREAARSIGRRWLKGIRAAQCAFA